MRESLKYIITILMLGPEREPSLACYAFESALKTHSKPNTHSAIQTTRIANMQLYNDQNHSNYKVHFCAAVFAACFSFRCKTYIFFV